MASTPAISEYARTVVNRVEGEMPVQMKTSPSVKVYEYEAYTYKCGYVVLVH